MRELPQIGSFLGKLFADVQVVKWPAALLAAAVGYVLPEQAMRDAAWAAFYLVILDTVTGFAAVVSERAAGIEAPPISSARFGRVLVKLLAYFSVVSVVAIANHSIPAAKELQGASVTVVLTYILITEGISVLENVQRMGFRIPFGLDKWFRDRVAQAIDPPTKPPARS